MKGIPPAVLALALLAACTSPGETPRFHTDRSSDVALELPAEEDMFQFAIFGDRTGGPAEGIEVLAEAVDEVNLIAPDLVMTVGDLIQGYNETPEWHTQMQQYRRVMGELACPWFPVAGNHDVYWRGEGTPPPGEHEADYEAHFGPLWYAFQHKRNWFVVLYSDEGDPETGAKGFDRPALQRMSPEQKAWLADVLSRAREAEHVFVFLHHPRWLEGPYGDDWEEVHAMLAAAGNVAAVFAGHIHRMRYDGRRDGIEYFTLATTGGGQSGTAPRAGYLHQYHLVTVRAEGVAVTTYPVGSAIDPRKVTAEVSDDAERLSRELRPRFRGQPAFTADGALVDVVELEVRNPVTRPIEVTLTPSSPDSRWLFRPDHLHGTIDPEGFTTFTLSLQRGPGALDATYRPPALDLDVDYLAPGLRVPLPTRAIAIPLDVAALPAPPRPAGEGVLELDGDGDFALVEARRLRLPDGPLTVETWFRADAWKERQGLINKTEGSEYGFFLNAGSPAFFLHLDGAYRSVAAPDHPIETGTWHHLAAVFDGSELRLYLDGERLAASPCSGTRTANDLPFVVGADVSADGGANSFLRGALDEVRISTTARYGGPRFTPQRRFEPDGDTALLLHMDGVLAGEWLHDASGRHANARLRGDARVVVGGS